LASAGIESQIADR